jgi:hypothetical protein
VEEELVDSRGILNSLLVQVLGRQVVTHLSAFVFSGLPVGRSDGNRIKINSSIDNALREGELNGALLNLRLGFPSL